MGLTSRSILRSQSLHEQTYQALRSAILSGELAAGERLVETHLAEALEVSRTPIREALRQLQRENLVVVDAANGGLRVSKLSVDDAIHLYDCRIYLEQLSVVEACKNARHDRLVKLELLVQQAEKTTKEQLRQLTNYQLLHMDREFHQLLAESSGNPWLVSLLDQVFDKMALLRLRTMQYNPNVLDIRTEHRPIYEAIVQNNPEMAVRAIKEHLIASKARVIKEIEQMEQETPVPLAD